MYAEVIIAVTAGKLTTMDVALNCSSVIFLPAPYRLTVMCCSQVVQTAFLNRVHYFTLGCTWCSLCSCVHVIITLASKTEGKGAIKTHPFQVGRLEMGKTDACWIASWKNLSFS